MHGRILCALEASLSLWGRVDLRRVVAYLSPLAGVVLETRARGYLPDIARRAPGRGGALRAVGRLAYAGALREDERVRVSDEAMREVDRIADVAARVRARVLPGLARAIAEAGGSVPP